MTAKQLLIAEDDSFLRTLLLTQCQSLGMKTHAVANGEQLVSEALSYQYDIILTDIQMPICDGIAATRILRRLGYDRPIIAMSADEVNETGFDQILAKPIDMTQLAQLLQQTPAQDSVALQLDEELIALFYTNLQQLSSEFALALQLAQRDALRQICHKVKGGAASFGEADLAKLADKLQHQLLSDTPLEELQQSCQYFAQLLQQFGGSNART